MKKTNLLKTVACAIMITLVMTSTVFAGTVSSQEEVRGESYTKTYSGTVGHYTLAGDSTSSRTTAVNTSTSQRWFQCYVYRYNYESRSYDAQDSESKLMKNGEATTVEIPRSINSYIYDYEHIARGFYTSVYISTAVADEYRFEAWQYYRD